MTGKESKLSERIDALDRELQLLYDGFGARFREKKRRQHDKTSLREEEGVGGGGGGGERVSGELGPVRSNRTPAPQVRFKSKRKKKVDEDEIKKTQEDYKKFLQNLNKNMENINKNIAQNSEAIKKIASFTEISDLTEKPIRDITSVWNSGSSKTRNTSKVMNASNDKKTKSNFVDNVPVLKHRLLKTNYGGVVNEVDKLIKTLQFTLGNSDPPSSPPTKDTCEPSDNEIFRLNMEENLIALNIMKDKLCLVKKKLQDEKSKRECAEKAIAGYRRRLKTLEAKEKKHVGGTLPSSENIKEENLKKSLDAREEYDKKKREMRNKIKGLEKAVEDNRLEIAKLEESRDCALALADTFRDNVCTHDPRELERLQTEKELLERALEEHRREVAPAGLIDSLLERAERAEAELREKMKECNQLLARCSVNDPEVQDLLERHKSAYRELEKEKRHREQELKNKCTHLKKKLEMTQHNTEARLKALSEKFQETEKELAGKESALQGIRNCKKELEAEITQLNKQLKEAYQKNDRNEETIKSLTESLKITREKLEMLGVEYDRSKQLLISSIDEKLTELNERIAEKDKLIESVRGELEVEKDRVKIAEKLLSDQRDTIKCLRTVADNTKRSLDEERRVKLELSTQLNKLKVENQALHKRVAGYEKRLVEGDTAIKLIQQNNSQLLADLEKKTSSRQEQLEKQLELLTFEKDQAIQTARFATEKLVLAINDYEAKLSVQKRIYSQLNEDFKMKEYQLEIANHQLNELNEELWSSAKKTEELKQDFQTRLWRACEVCADVIDAQIQKEF